MKFNKNILSLGLIGAGLISSFKPGAQAQVTGYNIFKEDFLNQTGPTTVTSSDWTVTANLYSTNASDIGTATVTPPSGTAYPLAANPGTPPSYAYRGNFATKSALDAAFPSGSDYTFAVSGGTLGSESGVLSVPTETTLPYPSAVPSISNYSAIQNLNPSLGATFRFSGFTDITGGTESSLLFFDIYNATTGAEVFSRDFLSASTTSVVVPAGTLNTNTAYIADLDYSNRDTASTTGFNGATPFTGFDYNTGAAFSTVPEPAARWIVLGAGGLLVAGFCRCRVESNPTPRSAGGDHSR